MTPEEGAAWFVRHKAEFRKLEDLRCDCSADSIRAVASMYAYSKGGQRLLWVGPRQGITQDGAVVKSRARAVDPDAHKESIEMAQCPRCRRGVLLMITQGRVRAQWLESPTRGQVTD